MKENDFSSEWKSFLNDLEYFCKSAVKHHKKLHKKSSNHDNNMNTINMPQSFVLLNALIADLFLKLKAERVSNTLVNLIRHEPDQTYVSYIIRELKFFHQLKKDVRTKIIINNGIGLKIGDTIKNSIETTFTLPDWLKKLFHVLNEILKIVSYI